MQTFGLNVVIFVRFSPEVCIFGLLESISVGFKDDCAILDKSIQIHENADRQVYDANGHRDSQLDDHEQ